MIYQRRGGKQGGVQGLRAPGLKLSGREKGFGLLALGLEVCEASEADTEAG